MAAELLLRRIVNCRARVEQVAMETPPPADQLLNMAGLAAGELERRRLRSNHFNRSMFSEPAWDILLLLYAEDRGQRFTTVRIAELVETPLSSVIRWIGYLEKEKLVERDPHPTDRRAYFVSISDKAKRAIEEYFWKVGGGSALGNG